MNDLYSFSTYRSVHGEGGAYAETEHTAFSYSIYLMTYETQTGSGSTGQSGVRKRYS